MQSYVDGAEIECALNGSHHDWKEYWGDTPGWAWLDYEYRIKPKPREFWINSDGVGLPTAHSSKDKAIGWSQNGTNIIHVREVE